MVSEFVSRETLIAELPSDTRRANIRQQFLRFHLLPDMTALLSVQHIAEILSLPIGQVVPIPQLQPWVMGVYNWRGEILWIVDLGHLIGLPSLHQQSLGRSNYQVIIIHEAQQSNRGQQGQVLGRKVLGLVVNQVEEMEWWEPGLIQPPPGFSVTPELGPFLQGYLLKSNGDLLVVLDSLSIIARMPQK